jgi:two-component system response regulator PilR (NtrC family)
MTDPIVLIVDDEPDICQLLEMTLNRMGISTQSVQTFNDAKKLIEKKPFNLCLTDMRLPDGDGLDLISLAQLHQPHLPVAVITAHGNMETAIKALKNGAFDFISKPIDLSVLRDMVSIALKANTVHSPISSDYLVGTSPIMEVLRENIAKVARSQAPVYISGPSGSGKELVAKIIHQSGPRNDQPFIPINCGAIPQELMESEFFGHKKGSFTGATADKIGFFQAAHKGTLFLDEVADLPLNMQVKLLRAIQEKSIRPVGSATEISVDVRILCATHKNLHELVANNLFRQDLFYRLNVIELKVPSVKERIEDIPLLIAYILKKIALANNSDQPEIDPATIELLKKYTFPGNVRELENILERALTLSNGKKITLTDLQLPIPPAQITENTNDELPLDDYLYTLERQAILNAIEKAQGNKTAAAKLLGVSFRTLRYRLKKLGLDSEAG